MQGQREPGAGWGGENFFSECASPARLPPTEDLKKKKKAREGSRGQTQASTLKRETLAGSPTLTLSRKAAEVSSAQTWAQTLHKETPPYVKQYFNTVICFFVFPFLFFFNQKKKK